MREVSCWRPNAQLNRTAGSAIWLLLSVCGDGSDSGSIDLAFAVRMCAWFGHHPLRFDLC